MFVRVRALPVDQQLRVLFDPSAKYQRLALELFHLPQDLFAHCVWEEPHESSYLPIVIEGSPAGLDVRSVGVVPVHQARRDVFELGQLLRV